MTKREKVMRASRNERTSKRVASIAGKVLRILEGRHPSWPVTWLYAGSSGDEGRAERQNWLSVGELKALAASALTQAPNKGIVRATARPKKAGRVGRK